MLARFAGVGLFALGIACLPSTATGSHRSAVSGLIVFNVGVASLFTWVGVATTLRGALLWPVVVLHAAIAAALLPQLLTYKRRLAIGGEERVGKGLWVKPLVNEPTSRRALTIAGCRGGGSGLLRPLSLPSADRQSRRI